MYCVVLMACNSCYVISYTCMPIHINTVKYVPNEPNMFQNDLNISKMGQSETKVTPFGPVFAHSVPYCAKLRKGPVPNYFQTVLIFLIFTKLFKKL